MNSTAEPHSFTQDNQDAAQQCVSVLFNPVSGRSDPEDRKRAISDALAEHGYRCQFLATTRETGAKALAEQAIRSGVDLLVVSGGDGTVMEALDAAAGTEIPVAVLPAGTGNLLSVNLGIPPTLPEAVHIALSGTPRAIDLVKTDSGRLFAIMGGIGADARMIADADREAKDRLGLFAYLWAILKNLPRRPAHVLITLDGRPPIRRRAKTVLLANMGKVSGGLEAFPTAKPDDGLLDIGIVMAESFGQWLRLLGYTLLGRSQAAPDFEVHQAKRVQITTRTPELTEFDGEEGEQTRELAAEIVPQAVKILLPADSPAAQDLTSPVLLTPGSRLPALAALGGLIALGIWLWKRRGR